MSRLPRSTFLLLISNVGSAVLSFALSALIGRAFGGEGLGIYALVMAWIYPISLLVEFGIGTLITRDLAQRPDLTNSLLRDAILARLILGGTAFLALLVLSPLFSTDARVVVGIRISAPMILLLPLFSTFTAVFRARQLMLPIPILNISMLGIQLIMTLLALLNGGGLLGVLIANVASSAVQLIATYWLYRHYIGAPANPTTPIDWLGLLRRAWHFALAALFAALQLRLSTILLEALADTRAVGDFYAASRFAEAARLIPNAFFGAFFPMLSAVAANPAQLNTTFRRAMTGLGGFGLLAGILISVASSFLITLVYGEDFQSAIPVMIVLSWSLIGGLLRGGRTLYWYALGRENLVNGVNGTAILLQIALSLWLIPAYGAIGAALVQVIIELAAFVVLWSWRPSKLQIPQQPSYETS